MMRSFRTLLAAAVLLPMSPALAADPPKAAEDPRICKTERSLSSRIVREVCKTASEWRNDSVAARNKLKMSPKSQVTEAFKAPAGQ